jgi:uncharacterized protein
VHEGGENVLMVAVRAGHADIVKLLLCSGGSISQPAVDVNATTAAGGTALHIAACRDRTDAAALLLQHSAAVNIIDHISLAPLALAAANASAEFVQLLLNAGAAMPVQRRGVTVLHAAAKNKGHPEVLQLLFEHSSTSAMIDNVAVECECCGPRTPIMMCDQPAHLKILLAAGADVHKATVRGNTALHVAAVHKHPASVLCLLIKAGVDLHPVNSDGKTAAQVAADSGNTLAAALLTRAARDT